MFGWEFPPYHKGGLGIATYHLAHALAKQGVSLTFVLPKRLPVDVNEFNLLFAEGSQPIKVKEIDSLLTAYSSVKEYREKYRELARLQRYGSTLMEEVKRYAKTVREFIQDGGYEIIHAHDWLTIGAGMSAKVALERPLIKHVHATEVERSGGNGVNEMVYQVEREGMHASDAVITVSHKTKDIVNNHYGVSHDKLHVVHNGIDVSKHSIDEIPLDESLMKLKAKGKKLILYLGRLTIAKAPDIFLHAFKRLLEYEKDAVLVIVGSGEMEQQLVQFVAEQGMSDKVLFTGWVKDIAKINSIYKTVDLFVMPSIMEPFGLVPLESLVNNTPVLISKQSGVSEVLNHALKVDFWDTEEMVNKMASVLKHASLQSELASNGKQEVNGITWDKAAKKCVDLYEKILFERNTKHHFVIQ